MRSKRFGTPNSFHCFQPHHMLLTEAISRLFWWIVPGKRPMDNVDLSWGSPQEIRCPLCDGPADAVSAHGVPRQRAG